MSESIVYDLKRRISELASSTRGEQQRNWDILIRAIGAAAEAVARAILEAKQ